MKKSFLFLALALSAGLSLKLSGQLSESAPANQVEESSSDSLQAEASGKNKPFQNADQAFSPGKRDSSVETRNPPLPQATSSIGIGEPQTIDRSPAEQSTLDAAYVKKALAHPDASTRFNALLQFQGDDKAIAFEKLVDIIQFDPSPKVRMAALRISRNHPQSDSEKLRALLNIALNDGNEEIRAEARNVLDQLEDSASQVQVNDQPDPQSQQIGKPPL
jgi:hypothetical protein